MEKSVDCLSGWSLCLLRLAIMSNKKRWEWLKSGEMELGEIGAQESFQDRSMSHPSNTHPCLLLHPSPTHPSIHCLFIHLPTLLSPAHQPASAYLSASHPPTANHPLPIYSSSMTHHLIRLTVLQLSSVYLSICLSIIYWVPGYCQKWGTSLSIEAQSEIL